MMLARVLVLQFAPRRIQRLRPFIQVARFATVAKKAPVKPAVKAPPKVELSLAERAIATAQRLLKYGKKDTAGFLDLIKKELVTTEEAVRLLEASKTMKLTNEPLYEAFMQFFSKRKNAEAIKLMWEMLKVDPVNKSKRLQEDMVLISRDLQLPETALDVFNEIQKVVKHTPSDSIVEPVLESLSVARMFPQGYALIQSVAQRGFPVNASTYAHMMKPHARLGDHATVQLLCDDMMKRGTTPSENTCYYQIEAFLVAGKTDEALEVFNKARAASVLQTQKPYAMLVRHFGKAHNLEKAIELYDYLVNDKIVRLYGSYNCMMEAFIENDKLDDALKLFAKMQNSGGMRKPDLESFRILLYACLQAGEEARVQDLWSQLKQANNCDKPSAEMMDHMNSLIKARGLQINFR